MDKAISLISSGIDSPVASDIMLNNGLEIIFLHFITNTKNNKQNRIILKILKILAKKFKKSFKLYIINNEKINFKFKELTNNRYACVFCKRTMLMIAEKIAKKESAEYIITGENLGQVASQTLDNMAVISNAVGMPILRPLLTFDKQEIIDYAKKIETFETSIEKDIACRNLPKNPITKAKQNLVDYEQKKVNIKELIDKSINNAVIEIINP